MMTAIWRGTAAVSGMIRVELLNIAIAYPGLKSKVRQGGDERTTQTVRTKYGKE
jgi:hypothetical protein